MNLCKRSVLFLFLFLTAYFFKGQTFYNSSSIQKIEINFSQPNWDQMMDTAKHGKEGYIMAQWVKINGTYFDSVGVKYKGNSSFDSTYKKNPLHIELNTYKSQDYQGYKDIKLGNCYADPSMIREVLSYDILKNYMHCPQANFAQLYINGKYIGIYSNAESINKKFLAEHFNTSNGTFFKCNPTTTLTTATKSNLKYVVGGDSSSYFNWYELKSDFGWKDLEALCDSVTNHGTTIKNILDVDRFIWMLAFDNVLVNLDSYMGVYAQNYYLYKDQHAKFDPIIWDLNMSFGGFPFVGSGNTSQGSLSIANMQNLSATVHSTDPYWPLINAIISNARYKRMYIAHMRTIINEMFSSGYYQTKASQLQAIADTAVLSDPNKFFTYTQFQNAMNTNYSIGTYSVPGITTLMNSRVSYLLSTPDFTATAPSITSVTPNISNPQVNSTVAITAQVTNANSTSVYLGYRFLTSDKFTRVQMYDDGMHNDGAASDNKFGVSITMISAAVQYYIYAENNNAGIFSPERAEHEYHNLVGVATATPGQVKINEFLANNVSDVKNEYNLNEDWIELYNTTADPLSLTGLYLTDAFSNPTKYVFPLGIVIQPYSHLIVWADQAPGLGNNVHCNFKLSAGGDNIMLSNQAGAVLDSISFGAQTADVSMGRCPDGVGTYSTFPLPSFNAYNCGVGIAEFNKSENFVIYPNPANDYFIIRSEEGQGQIEILNALGEFIYTENKKEVSIIHTKNWASGIYFVREGSKVEKVIVTH